MRRLALVLVIVPLVLSACGDDDDSGSSSSTTTSSTEASTTSGSDTTTSTPPITAGGESVEQCAQEVFDAWVNNVEGAATLCANSDAVGQLFDQAYTAGEYATTPDCGDPGAGQVQCTFAASGSGTQNLVMSLSDGTGGPIVVESVSFESA